MKIIVLSSHNKGDCVKRIKLLFFLYFCSRKQKYLDKRITFKYSMYSILLKSINGHPMFVKIIFSNSPNKGGYVKPVYLHFSLNFCSRKQNYLEKRITFKYSMYSVILRGINRPPKCTKIMFLNSPNLRGYIKSINLRFQFLKFCFRNQNNSRNGMLSSILCILSF